MPGIKRGFAQGAEVTNVSSGGAPGVTKGDTLIDDNQQDCPVRVFEIYEAYRTLSSVCETFERVFSGATRGQN